MNCSIIFPNSLFIIISINLVCQGKRRWCPDSIYDKNQTLSRCWFNVKTITFTLTTLNYLCLNYGAQRVFFQFEIIKNVLVTSFSFICSRIRVGTNIVVISGERVNAGLQRGTVFIRQNLTSVDVRFWCIKTAPAPKECQYLYFIY